jgi:hypothetical protein
VNTVPVAHVGVGIAGVAIVHDPSAWQQTPGCGCGHEVGVHV